MNRIHESRQSQSQKDGHGARPVARIAGGVMAAPRRRRGATHANTNPPPNTQQLLLDEIQFDLAETGQTDGRLASNNAIESVILITWVWTISVRRKDE